MVIPCRSAANAAAGTLFNTLSALWAYAHSVSILVILACLIAERHLIQPSMTVEDEDTVIKIDLVLGLMGVLLVGSGFVRAIHFGQGGDYYIREVAFWIKMCLAGIWGGLTLFPSIIFYRRKMDRNEKRQQSPISPALAMRLRKVLNAELSAILFIPLLASLMTRGVFYSPNFVTRPVIGIVTSIAVTLAAFALYARKAFTWKEPHQDNDK